MRYTKMNPNDFKHMTFGAGIIVDEFTPATGAVQASAIRWATTGDNSFTATRDMLDMGADINNCPENTMQLQRAKNWVAQLKGTAVTITPADAAEFLGNADVDTTDTTKITPRPDLSIDDFKSKWLIVNYSDLNGDTNGGHMAIHLMNALNIDGFSGTFAKEGNGQFAYTLKAFYDMDDMSTVPFEIYIKAGTAESEVGG